MDAAVISITSRTYQTPKYRIRPLQQEDRIRYARERLIEYFRSIEPSNDDR